MHTLKVFPALLLLSAGILVNGEAADRNNLAQSLRNGIVAELQPGPAQAVSTEISLQKRGKESRAKTKKKSRPKAKKKAHVKKPTSHGHQGQHVKSGKSSAAGKQGKAGKQGNKAKPKSKLSLPALSKKVLAYEKTLSVKSCPLPKKKQARDLSKTVSIARRASPPGSEFGSDQSSEYGPPRVGPGWSRSGKVLQGFTKTAGPGEELITSAMLPCLGIAVLAGDGSKIVAHIQPDAVQHEYPAFHQQLQQLHNRISHDMQTIYNQIPHARSHQEKNQLETRLHHLSAHFVVKLSLPSPQDGESYTSDPNLRAAYAASVQNAINTLLHYTQGLVGPQDIYRRSAPKKVGIEPDGEPRWEVESVEFGFDEDGEVEHCTMWTKPPAT